MAKMIDERPMLIFSFNTQQVTVIRDKSGKIVEGSEDDVERVHYVIAMVKDKELNPITGGWKVMEIGIQASMKTW
jgi:predicted lipid-binding transport protein (Tim44 family)